MKSVYGTRRVSDVDERRRASNSLGPIPAEPRSMRVEKNLPQLNHFGVLSEGFDKTAGEALLLLGLAVEESLQPGR